MTYQFIQTFLDFLFPPLQAETLIRNLTLEEILKQADSAEDTPDEVRAFLSYRDPFVKKLIWFLKYGKNEKALELCAELFLEKMAEEISEKMEWGGGEKYLLIPIPMSKKRLKERGSNHTELLARKIMDTGGEAFFELPVSSLVRTKETPPQTSIRKRGERLKNMEGVFSIRNPSLIFQKKVVLLDDVTTTGATLLEAKNTLIEGGVKNVLCVAIAH